MSTAEFVAPAQSRVDEAIRELKALLGNRASTADSVRENHSHGESYHDPVMPDVVCLPHSTQEVSEIVKLSAKYKIAVVPFGAGSSLEGQVNPIYGGISIDMREMNKVLRISAEDLNVTVQAGVSRLQLNKALANTGLAFFVDPGADCTIGGMAATRASGTTAVRYGTMKENVMALTVVLSDGRIIHTGTRAKKSSAGYDLTHLFVGAEGTLGVITEVTLKLNPQPESVAVASCAFPTIEDAVETAIETIQLGLAVARIELLDEMQIQMSNRYSKTDYPVAPTLLFEFHGDNVRSVSEQAEAVQELANGHKGQSFQWFATLEEREKLWKMRHDVLFALLAMRPGSKFFGNDICVPISRLAECIREARQQLVGAPFPATILGHVGDGNFHIGYALDPSNKAERELALKIEDTMIRRALEMGGTCTGEHGIGIARKKYLPVEHGESLNVMRAIKFALDPENRMNPGKMVDPQPL